MARFFRRYFMTGQATTAVVDTGQARLTPVDSSLVMRRAARCMKTNIVRR